MHKFKKKDSLSGWRLRLHEIIYEADTPAGKLFDVFLITSILLSVFTVLLDSVGPIRALYGNLLLVVEWVFTILFTVEYVLRLISVGRAIRYATSFYGIVDLLAIIPTYLSLIIAESKYLLVIRVLRILRIFRIFKLIQYLSEAALLLQALRASSRKIFVFLFAVLTLVIIFGSLMYIVEGEEHGFTSIPKSIYWTIVTITTVGYGDISPKTNFGQFLATIVMLMGYGIIAVPTGIVTVEVAQIKKKKRTTQACTQCSAEGHDSDAKFCKYCGSKL